MIRYVFVYRFWASGLTPTGSSPRKAKSDAAISFSISVALRVSTKCHLWLTRLSDLPWHAFSSKNSLVCAKQGWKGNAESKQIKKNSGH